MKIAILDDDPAVLDQVNCLLTQNGHTCQTYGTGRLLMRALQDENFDLFVLDWNVPDLSGISILTWIRNTIGITPPVLLLTNRTSEEDIVEGLRAGADEYIVKPFQPAIFMARIDALLRRAQQLAPSGPLERYGAFEFDVAVQAIRHDGSAILVTSKEFQLALLLFRNLQRALPRSYIFETLWGRNPDLPTRTLDSHISKIRTKLNLRPENGYTLVPVYAYGYRLEENVVRT